VEALTLATIRHDKTPNSQQRAPPPQRQTHSNRVRSRSEWPQQPSVWPLRLDSYQVLRRHVHASPVELAHALLFLNLLSWTRLFSAVFHLGLTL